jgi:hypothetical protein
MSYNYLDKIGPLVYGGTSVDDTIMDLVVISEIAEIHPEVQKELDELCELINAIKHKICEEFKIPSNLITEK